MNMILSIFLIIIGFALLIGGANLLIEGASGIAKKFHIPEIIIGLTIVSIGTSVPELVVSVNSAIKGYSDMSIGNVIGSNLSNILLVLGFSTILKSIFFEKETIKYEIPMCLIFTTILIIFCNTGIGISRLEAIILLILFCLFIVYTIFMGKNHIKEYKNIEEISKNNMIKNISFIAIGIVGLKFGGDLAVNNAVNVGEIFNLSEKIISLTILAVGTSLPELVTSITAIIKGNSEISIGNIIGSNIFNMLLITGVSSVIEPIVYNNSYNLEFNILFLATLILAVFPFIPPKKEMSRAKGVLFFLMYIAYISMLFA